MTTLVTGANGLLGGKLCALLAGENVVAAARGAPRGPAAGLPFYALDVADRAAVDRVMDLVAPRYVIHAAALTDVDGCEQRRDEAWRTNAEGAANVARAAARVGARLVYVSTEYVFDGAAGPYSETDLPNPRGVYAITKYAGEKATEVLCADHVIARTTVVYGHAPWARLTFASWLVGALRRGESVRVVEDQVGSPTLADNLAAMLWALARGTYRGVVHTVGDAVLSRHAFATALARAFGLDPARIAPVPTAALGQAAPRPLRAGLRTDLVKRLVGPEARPLGLDEGLAAFKTQMEAG